MSAVQQKLNSLIAVSESLTEALCALREALEAEAKGNEAKVDAVMRAVSDALDSELDAAERAAREAAEEWAKEAAEEAAIDAAQKAAGNVLASAKKNLMEEVMRLLGVRC